MAVFQEYYFNMQVARWLMFIKVRAAVLESSCPLPYYHHLWCPWARHWLSGQWIIMELYRAASWRVRDWVCFVGQVIRPHLTAKMYITFSERPHSRRVCMVVSSINYHDIICPGLRRSEWSYTGVPHTTQSLWPKRTQGLHAPWKQSGFSEHPVAMKKLPSCLLVCMCGTSNCSTYRSSYTSTVHL